MNGMKYLVYQLEGSPETERLYLFPADEVHAAFHQAINMHGWKVVRGGFVPYFCDALRSDEGYFRCQGEASSLGLTSDKIKDTALLRRQIAVEL